MKVTEDHRTDLETDATSISSANPDKQSQVEKLSRLSFSKVFYHEIEPESKADGDKTTPPMALHLSKKIINNSSVGGASPASVATSVDMDTLQESTVTSPAPLSNLNCTPTEFFNLTKSKKIDLSCLTPRLKVTSVSSSPATETTTMGAGTGTGIGGNVTTGSLKSRRGLFLH